MISYEPLWKTLKKKVISQYELINMGVDRKTMDGLRHNRNITAVTIDKLCNLLDCTPNDILECTKNVKWFVATATNLFIWYIQPRTSSIPEGRSSSWEHLRLLWWSPCRRTDRSQSFLHPLPISSPWYRLPAWSFRSCSIRRIRFSSDDPCCLCCFSEHWSARCSYIVSSPYPNHISVSRYEVSVFLDTFVLL